MDFKDNILQLAERIAKQKDAILTEEATKTAFIMPMIVCLGYDVFNPFEVVPEMDCDLTRRGDKVDYAIKNGEKVILLIECKQCSAKLNLHNAQLSKYYAASNARFGVLTNGVEYRFYADLDKLNIMDENPFLIVNITDLSDEDIEHLKKFHKSYFNESGILESAQELKYTTSIKSFLNSEIQAPSYDFVRFIGKHINIPVQVTPKVVEQLTPIVKRSIGTIINDIIQDRLELAGKTIEQEERTEADSYDNLQVNNKNGVITTQEELDAFNIIKDILSKNIDTNSILYKDFKSYFVIGIAEPSYWWVCRLYFGTRKKTIVFPTNDYTSNERVEIQSLDDITSLSEKLTECAKLAEHYHSKWVESHK